MTQLTKGGNAPLTAHQVVLTVDVGAPADLSALLVTESGKVRSDADFVFYNQPTGPGVRCVQPAGGQGWRVEVDLGAGPRRRARRPPGDLPRRPERGASARVGQPVARVTDGAGGPQAEFTMTGLDSESIVVALELYRRAGVVEGARGGPGLRRRPRRPDQGPRRLRGRRAPAAAAPPAPAAPPVPPAPSAAAPARTGRAPPAPLRTASPHPAAPPAPRPRPPRRAVLRPARTGGAVVRPGAAAASGPAADAHRPRRRRTASRAPAPSYGQPAAPAPSYGQPPAPPAQPHAAHASPAAASRGRARSA